MASNMIFNGTTFDGTPVTNPTHPYKPDADGITVKVEKIGTLLIAANGRRRFVQRTNGGTPIVKHTWDIPWSKTNEITRAAVRALHQLTTTWTFVDQLGVSYTVQTEGAEFDEGATATTPANAILYNIKLTIREA